MVRRGRAGSGKKNDRESETCIETNMTIKAHSYGADSVPAAAAAGCGEVEAEYDPILTHSAAPRPGRWLKRILQRTCAGRSNSSARAPSNSVSALDSSSSRVLLSGAAI